MLGYGAYVVFFQFCKQAFPEISDQTVARMVAGIDVIMYRPDDELKGWPGSRSSPAWTTCSPRAARRTRCSPRWPNAARRAAPGSRRLRRGPPPVVPRVHRRRLLPSPPELERRPHGARSPRYPATCRRSAPAELADRPTEHAAGRAGTDRRRVPRPAGHRRGARRVRPDARAVPARLPVRGGPQVLLRALVHHPVLPEDKGVRRAARRARACSPTPTTSSTCTITEIDQALADVMLAWASGGPPLGAGPPAPHHRRAQADAGGAERLVATAGARPGARGAQRPGRADAVGHHPGDHRVLAASRAEDDEVRGYAASSGVVEGTARVLRDVNEIGAIRDGEILVCPVTAPSWGPVFGKIKAAVSDIGGTMSHAAIVAREYGHARRRGDRPRDEADQDRPAGPGRRRPRCRHIIA